MGSQLPPVPTEFNTDLMVHCSYTTMPLAVITAAVLVSRPQLVDLNWSFVLRAAYCSH